MPPPGENIIDAYREIDGYGTLDNPERFLDQDYEALKYYCLDQGLTFVDDMFPPDITSIGEGVLGPDDMERIEWLRPGDLVSNPTFVEDGVSRFDFSQGAIANCWLLAPLGALTIQRDFLRRVIPTDQSFDEDYCGLFHFRFWQFGSWVDVVIDDKLPTIDGKLIFVRSTNEYEFWPALLEKAYAKVCGSYEDLNGGFATEALVDFSGCVHVHVKVSENPSNLWELMKRANQGKSMMVCVMRPDLEELSDPILPNGLIENHGYTVTGVQEVMSGDKAVNLVRLWNPWGEGEWTGDWSDESALWETVESYEQWPPSADEGEFWISLEDFTKFYTDLNICSESPDFLDGSPSSDWTRSEYDGRWIAGTTAGGSRNFSDTYWTNPQYRVTVGEPPSEGSETEGGVNMLVSLMQKPDERNSLLDHSLFIGFSVYKVTEEYETWTEKFPAAFFNNNKPVAGPEIHINAREVTELMMLEPGDYLIVPATYNQDETASFILTIVSKVEIYVQETTDGDFYEPMEEEEAAKIGDVKTVSYDSQLSSKYEGVGVKELQEILNEKILKGDMKTGGFSTESCHSMVALLDISLTGKLSSEEFLVLWNKVNTYKDIFETKNVSKTGKLSKSELQEAIAATGIRVPDDLRNLMAVRFGAKSGEMTLQSFIVLVLRLDCMNKLYGLLSDKKTLTLTLREKEWLHLSMYT